MQIPQADPVQVFEAFNANFGSKILVAAAVHFDLFNQLKNREVGLDQFCAEFELEERPSIVLTSALCGLGLLLRSGDGGFTLSESSLAFLTRGQFDVSDYLDLAADADGVLDLVERLRTNRPAGHNANEQGTQYIFRDGEKSAMADTALARKLTFALAGRARITAPLLAEKCPLDAEKTLLDIGGGTGIFSVAYLQKHPKLKAIIIDLPDVLDVAKEIAADYGVLDRMEFCEADMFVEDLPEGADAILLSNVLHDWGVPDCKRLLQRCHSVLADRGKLIIHDAFLDDDHCGPSPIAIYSVILFYLTEGRAYSAAECFEWLRETGFESDGETHATMVHCSAMMARKRH